MKTTKKDALANSFARFKNQELENPDAIHGGVDIIVIKGDTKNYDGSLKPDAQVIYVPEGA